MSHKTALCALMVFGSISVYAADEITPCDGKSIRLTDGSCTESLESNPTRKATFDDGHIEGEIQRPMVEYLSADRKSKFKCDIKSPDFEQCVLGPIQKEKDIVFQKLVEEYAETLSCPKNFNDIDKLKNIQAQYDKNPQNVDVDALIIKPIKKKSGNTEPHLPISCGYNSGQKIWFKVPLFCKSQTSCANNINGFLTTVTQKMELIPYETNIWKATTNYGRSSNERSYRDGGNLGDARLISLSEGIYLQSGLINGEYFYYGLILTPTEKQYLVAGCKQELKIRKNGSELSPEKLKQEEYLASGFIRKAMAMKEIKNISRQLFAEEAREKVLSSDQKEDLEKRLKELSKLVGTKNLKEKQPLGSACSLLQDLTK